MGIVVRRCGASDLPDLFRFTTEVHDGDRCWVAPLARLEARRVRSFLDNGRLVLFVAEDGGQIVGSISVLRDRGYEAKRGEAVAWFGFVETRDDPAILERLAACADGVARGWGCDRLRGPRNLTRFEYMGITVEGHASRPPFLQGHHPPYYAAHLEAVGFRKHHDVLAYDTPVFDEAGRPRPLPEPLKSKAEACHIPGLQIRPMSRWHATRDLIDAHEILNTAFASVPDTSPMPRSTFLTLGRTFLTVADPRLLQIARVDGRPVGFGATFPELNGAIAPMHGRILPLGWWRGLKAMRRLDTASFKLIGVVPELRGSGLHARLIEEIVRGVGEAGYSRLEASVIDERNAPMRAVVEHAGMTVYRRYRLFERPL